MKRIKVISTPQEFEDFVNDPDIEVLVMDVKGCEQSAFFQYSFIAVIVYIDHKNKKP